MEKIVSEPQVSIVMPAYNHENLIADAILSVREQTFGMWELVVVNDGSTDATIDQARIASGSDPRIRLLSQPNRGPNAARRYGLNGCSLNTEFLAFLDSDDIWEPDALEFLLDQLRTDSRAVAVFGKFRQVDTAGNEVTPWFPPKLNDDTRLTLEDFTKSNCGAMPSVTLMRRWAYEACGGFDPDFLTYDEHEQWLRMSLHGPFLYRDKMVASKIIHGSNMSAQSNLEVYRPFFEERCRCVTRADQALDRGFARPYARGSTEASSAVDEVAAQVADLHGTMPIVSIVIPVFNRPAYIAEAIASVRNQTCQAWELIVVDDGSTDDTYSRALEAAVGDRRITIVSRENGGVSLARRHGLTAKSSRTEFLIFLDSDDIWLPNMLECLLPELLRRPNAVACYGSYKLVNAELESVEGYNEPPQTRRNAILGSADLEAKFYSTCPSVMLLRRWAYEAAGGFDTGFDYAEDHDLWLRMCHFGPFVYVNETIALKRNHDKNLSQAPGRHKIGPTFARRRVSYKRACYQATGVYVFFIASTPTESLTGSISSAEDNNIIPTTIWVDQVAQPSQRNELLIKQAIEGLYYNHIVMFLPPNSRIVSGHDDLLRAAFEIRDTVTFAFNSASEKESIDTFVEFASVGTAGAYLNLYERFYDEYLESLDNPKVGFFTWIWKWHGSAIRVDAGRNFFDSMNADMDAVEKRGTCHVRIALTEH